MPLPRTRPSPRKKIQALAQAEDRDGFKFRSGRLALDLTATMASRLKAEPKDLLATPKDLSQWLVAAGLAAKLLEASQADLTAARDLREALYRLARACVLGKPLAVADRALVNRWAAEPPCAPQLDTKGRMAWTGNGVRATLSTVARDGVELFGSQQAFRIRNCSREGCALLFVDTSRSGQRRWCSMSVCGNKVKVGAFRQRQRSESLEPD